MQADVSNWPELENWLRNAFCYKNSPYWTIITKDNFCGSNGIFDSILGILCFGQHYF